MPMVNWLKSKMFVALTARILSNMCCQCTAVGQKVLVQQGGYLHSAHMVQQNGNVIDPFDFNQLGLLVPHRARLPQLFNFQKPLFF